MRHAEKLIGRIIFLNGKPVVSDLTRSTSAAAWSSSSRTTWTPKSARSQRTTRPSARPSELRDNGTRVILEGILHDEEEHVDWIEAQLDQIEQMGIQTYLVEQVG